MSQVMTYVSVALLVAIGLLYWLYLGEKASAKQALIDKAAAEAKVKVLESANKASSEAFGQLLAGFNASQAAVAHAREKIEAADRRLAARLKEIQDEPESDNGPVPPLLARGLDRLRYQANVGREADPSPAPPQ